MKSIDVLLATYNGSKYIEEQINSVLLNFDRLESFNCNLVISDDFSSDNTVNLIKNYCEIDSRIVFTNNDKKGGVRENFEFLIRMTKADYVFFCDQDDFWLPSKMEIFINKFIDVEKGNNKPVLIHSDLCVSNKYLAPIDSSMFRYQNINKQPTFPKIIASNSVTGCVMACNKKLIELARMGNIKDSIMHDWYMAMIAIAFGYLYFIDHSLILYRQHGNNQVGAKSFGLKEIFSIRSVIYKYKQAKISVFATRNQACLFLNDYMKLLNEDEKSLLRDFSSLTRTSIVGRFSIFFKQGVRKKGLLRNILFFYIYVVCNG
ncbi:glycosyltransferase family 2 protein [Pectobacterium carotovorum]|uniref:glycosyltransferase family 2 protein n=1 Tax=Pectobacterium carotovorum TaxID=554 RepID=UPI00057E7CC6|nr:glycosyltransferase family 2 protein [Pectobacterium carotovorum]KHT14078.1 glycosyl transferase family 2 [Pectobacterium carotovorum subsp. carotovorum]MBA0178172.1 glycosyltransferase family 2 protein [Pectobacterium carotovorum]MBB1527442.1 glycosyltransferase family 2 protein [Pectobacterium carotovorum subsp. carotovorum]MCA6965380.1 glycosyltransferase family 2 protein [Pectobacterium carotovorum]MCH4987804.1 glycosyltransferase family 2 protein [Pectobacterium carotovorum]